jgi:peptide deformylase
MKKENFDIVQRENPVLRDIAKAVPVKDITSKKIQKIIKRMKESLEVQNDGVAIAAPQIGVSLRIFVVSRKAEILIREKDGLTPEELEKIQDTVYINPEITKLSRDKSPLDEGCLSVRYLYGQVKRSNKATVTAYNEKGEKFIRGASGLIAQIFQHEIDHLNGILFIDKANNVVEVLPEQVN